MSFVKNTYVYLLSNILNATIPFILLPILTRYLSPSEYGQIAMFQTMLTGLTAFIGLNTVGAANRKFYDDNLMDRELRYFNGSCIQILLFTSIISFLFVYLSKDYISSFLSIPGEWLYIAIFVNACMFLINFRLGQWQVRKKAKKYGVLQISSSIVNMAITLFLVTVMYKGAEGRIDSLLYAGALSAFLSVILLYKDNLIGICHINKNNLKEALSFGVPLIPHIFGAFLLTASGRFIINDKLGLADAGIYMVSVQISMALSIVFDAINKAYVPWLFESLKKNNEEDKGKIVKNTYVYFIFILGLAGLSFIIGPIVISLVIGEHYRGAGVVIGWLCLGQVFGGMYLMVTNYIFYTKKTKLLSLITISSGLISVFAMYFLIPKYGIVGAAYATCFAMFIRFIMTWYASAKEVNMPWLLVFFQGSTKQ